MANARCASKLGKLLSNGGTKVSSVFGHKPFEVFRPHRNVIDSHAGDHRPIRSLTPAQRMALSGDRAGTEVSAGVSGNEAV
jgi:hypothetical protein